jgi:sRNA-binding carbon storage regulator CsrA
VRIGIEAPAETTILRGELVEQVAAQNRKASVAATGVGPLIASGSALAPKRTSPTS